VGVNLDHQTSLLDQQMNAEKLTPLMRQYWEIKSLHQDKILLFRMGDFFEMFYDDAVKAAPILGIALTSRNKKSQDDTPMCGMPHHSVAGPINKLLAHGLKVAICDQLEDPKLAKGIVKRGVTRILTPGMVYDADTLDGTKPHYLASFDEETVAFLDITTGDAFYFSINSSAEAFKILSVVNVAELVTDNSEIQAELLADLRGVTVTKHEELHQVDEVKSKAAARLLSYVSSLGNQDILRTVKPFVARNFLSRMGISGTVFKHLEVFATYKGESQGSLFNALNRTSTSAGARMLRHYLSFPLADKASIEDRLNSIEKWVLQPGETKIIRQILAQMGDIERRLGKINLPTCNARDLLALAQSIHSGADSLKAARLYNEQDSQLVNLAQKIEAMILEEPPISTRQGYMIRTGVSPELDELIMLSTQSQDLLLAMETKEKEQTGISSLKIRYNNVFGYYIEITNTHKDKVPARYNRKQTLANAERYCTEELIELERKVLSAQSKRNDLEYEYFEELRRTVLAKATELLNFANNCSQLDVSTALAWLAIEQNYVRPKFSTSAGVQLKASRHPVVEQVVRSQFIANDIEISEQHCLLLTGPNMAGKSTLMRQVALISLMAQIGSYVPAQSATLPIFDAIFTRIGASDQISEGLSTFMVEMVESAQMLKSATSKSLVILDEVGRGTSTFDGMALAQSILEYLLTEIRSITLFATHYHELTSLREGLPQIINAHMSVSEKSGEIRFLHTLAKGPALKSYGVHVAQLAGLPSSITQRAKNLLKEMESKKVKVSSQMTLDFAATEVESIPDSQKDVLAQLLAAKVNEMTPMDALMRLSKWQSTISGKN
jgi:DNA mismatch repair protein MutS